ncbi:MAG: tRNA (adenosine(37)-N6)-dimethylallyltransferase MiaA [Dehalococcoidia bacterium]|nr:tRNA (adenosine(37)-N6)-dimethylallyltransferase MiaA [Dehalococcoidia bacterium]
MVRWSAAQVSRPRSSPPSCATPPRLRGLFDVPLRPVVLAVVGPTASGKSRLALEVARALGGEIISADSRQVYRHMDIGTAKAGIDERSEVPHHLLDVVDPDQPYSIAEFRQQAGAVISDMCTRGRVPVITGGSGLYVRSLTDGLDVPAVPPDDAFRLAMFARAEIDGVNALHQELAAIDPSAAARINPRNVRRTIRALEVWRHTGELPSDALRRKHDLPFRVVKVGIALDRQRLYAAIDERVDRMVEAGLVGEVESLRDRGYGWGLPSMSGIGYRQIGAVLRGESTLSEAIDAIKFATHRFARQQRTWFRPDDEGINWLEPAAIVGRMVDRVLSCYRASATAPPVAAN